MAVNAASPHALARPIMAAAFARVMGRKPNLFELQYAQAIAFLESSYGRGWKGEMVGSNNWGAVQCASGNQSGCIPYRDSFPDGTTYAITFRSYASPEDGAVDVIRHVFSLRPRVAQALASGGATAFRASLAMRRGKYYGGFCPKATAQYGAQVARDSFAYPDRDGGTMACEQEAVSLHANRVANDIKTIADANGDGKVLPLGSYKESRAWYGAGGKKGASSSPGGGSIVLPVVGIAAAAALAWAVTSE